LSSESVVILGSYKQEDMLSYQKRLNALNYRAKDILIQSQHQVIEEVHRCPNTTNINLLPQKQQ
jgi:hypothetical protein